MVMRRWFLHTPYHAPNIKLSLIKFNRMILLEEIKINKLQYFLIIYLIFYDSFSIWCKIKLRLRKFYQILVV